MSGPAGSAAVDGDAPRPGSRTTALARAGLVVSGAFLASRALGYVRLTVTGAIFGASPQLDAFYAAFRIPDLIFQLVAAGALGSALVPVVAGLLAHGQERHAWRVVSTVANLMLIGLLVLAAVFWLAAPVVVPIITPGFDRAGYDLTIDLTRIMLAGPILLALGAVASSLLNAADRFVAASMAPIVYNVAIIAFAVALGPTLGVTALAIGVVVGSLANLVIQLPAIQRGTTYRYRPTVDVRDPTSRRVFALMAPRALGLGAVQVTFIVNTSLASGLGTGAIVAYNFAFTLLQLPLGLVAQPLGVVLLPAMSRAVALGDRREFGAIVDRSLRLLAYAMMLVTAVGIALHEQVVTLAFGYGRFGSDLSALALTSETLLIFLVGLPAHSLIAIQARAFYARQDTRTPVLAAVLAVVINVVVSVLTVGSLGLRGLALGIALGAWAEAVVLAVVLDRRGVGPGIAAESATWTLFAALAGLAGLAAWAVTLAFGAAVGASPGKPLLLVEATVATLVAIAVYTAAGLALRLEEPAALWRLGRRILPGGRA
ncbi:MAG TPA: murein biosynthesis integral membrane protein MurJ [Candidatus Dormibacteraeota bacterium]|nr:murein biosynthesis integral membrane protein MurJ [Candidatus Dormibacteraeota bacterium]